MALVTRQSAFPSLPHHFISHAAVIAFCLLDRSQLFQFCQLLLPMHLHSPGKLPLEPESAKNSGG